MTAQLLKHSTVLSISLLVTLLISTNTSYATGELNEYKPEQWWYRSTESVGGVQISTAHWGLIADAYRLPLDPNQVVFDNGQYTPEENKDAVPDGIEWASWPQYTTDPDLCDRHTYSLRHFRLNFNISEELDWDKVRHIHLRSPYYDEELYNYSTGVTTRDHVVYKGRHYNSLMSLYEGTVQSSRNLGTGGGAPYANETDGWVATSVIRDAHIASFRNGSVKHIDFVVGTTCTWGGFGKVELVFDVEGDVPTVPGGETAPKPFLRLPWDYEAKGKSFSKAALSINSFFDHEYPLLSVGWVVGEPVGVSDTVTPYTGKFGTKLDYSSHDGYDYGIFAGAIYNEPELAAADGTATFHNECAPCGNAIFIDHGNGYQTRYFHLDPKGLIVSTPGVEVEVTQGQEIGRIGFSGHTEPEDEPAGAHIHFMVVQDKNDDGNFEDNIPDGLVDPFGWQSEEEDPWPIYEYYYQGQNRTGNTSYYLWQEEIPKLDETLTANLAVFMQEQYEVEFPEGSTDEDLSLQITQSATPSLSDKLIGLFPALRVIAKDSANNIVHSLLKPFTISVGFSDVSMDEYRQDTFSIYSSEDGSEWTKEPTWFDWDASIARAEIDHLSYFALVAEPSDIGPPVTTPVYEGEEGEEGWFRTPVSLSLSAKDNENGSGANYTVYMIGDEGWTLYEEPLNFSEEGVKHTIYFYSVDNYGNAEEVKTEEFKIDSELPEILIAYDIDSESYLYAAQDDGDEISVSALAKKGRKIQAKDKAGNTLEMKVKERNIGKNAYLEITSLKYNDDPEIQTEGTKLKSLLLKGRRGKLRYLFQKYHENNSMRLMALYRRSKGATKIYGEGRSSRTEAGLTLINLRTKEGRIYTGVE